MANGGQFWPLSPRAQDLNINDIAHSLAMQVRWNGHIKHINNHYSVAQHSVYVSMRVERERARLWGLLHDSPEIWLSDLARPVKPSVTGYRPIEANLESFVIEQLNIEYDESIAAEVKRADTDLLFMERDKLVYEIGPYEDPPHVWEGEHLRPRETMFDIDPHFYCWPNEVAKQKFLERFEELTQ